MQITLGLNKKIVYEGSRREENRRIEESKANMVMFALVLDNTGSHQLQTRLKRYCSGMVEKMPELKRYDQNIEINNS